MAAAVQYLSYCTWTHWGVKLKCPSIPNWGQYLSTIKETRQTPWRKFVLSQVCFLLFHENAALSMVHEAHTCWFNAHLKKQSSHVASFGLLWEKEHMTSNMLTPLVLPFRAKQVNFMETDWPLGRSCTQIWLISKSSAAVAAVNHSDAGRGRFADNTDPFEVKVGRPPVP